MTFRATCMLRIGGHADRALAMPLLRQLLDEMPCEMGTDEPLHTVMELLAHLDEGGLLEFHEMEGGNPPEALQHLGALGLHCAWWSRPDAGVPPILHLYAGSETPKVFACDADEQEITITAHQLRRPGFDPAPILQAQDQWESIGPLVLT